MIRLSPEELRLFLKDIDQSTVAFVIVGQIDSTSPGKITFALYKETISIKKPTREEEKTNKIASWMFQF